MVSKYGVNDFGAVGKRPEQLAEQRRQGQREQGRKADPIKAGGAEVTVGQSHSAMVVGTNPEVFRSWSAIATPAERSALGRPVAGPLPVRSLPRRTDGLRITWSM